MTSLLPLGWMLFALEPTGSSALPMAVSEARARVESLAADVEAERAAQRDEILALRRRRVELEGQLAQQRLTLDALRARLAAQRATLASVSAGRDEERAPLRAAVADLRALIEDGAPVRAAERLQAVDRIAGDLDSLTVDAGAAAMWSLLEKEAELSASVGRVRHPIVVGGKPMMAEILHVGTALAWFRVRDGRLGLAIREGGVWGWRVVDDPAARARLQMLFDAARRDAARGLFVVPIPPSPPGSTRSGQE